MGGSKKTVALLTLSSCLLWQAAAVTHFCLVPHGAGHLDCDSHGETGVDPDEHQGRDSGHEQSDGECAFLAALTTARAEPVSTRDPAPALLPTPETRLYRFTENLPNSRELYRLSPSSSPPSSC